jgi:hypothetical protein
MDEECTWLSEGDRIAYQEEVVIIYVARMADPVNVRHVVALQNGFSTTLDIDQSEKWVRIHDDHIAGAESGVVIGVTSIGEDADVIVDLHNNWLDFVPAPEL